MSDNNILTICGWNVNSDRRVELGYAKDVYPEYKYSERHSAIMKCIKTVSPDILCLTELSSQSWPLLKHDLVDLGYKLVHHNYCEDQHAFAMVLACRKNVKIITHCARYFNVHPDKPTIRPDDFQSLTDKSAYTSQNFVQEFERSTLLCELEHSCKSFVICIMHPALQQNYNVKSMEMLPGFIEEFIADRNLSATTPLIMAGDFNTINADIMAAVNNMVEVCQVSNLTFGAPYSTLDGKVSAAAAKSTFVFYPYDLGIDVMNDAELKKFIQELLSLTPTLGREFFNAVPRKMITGDWCLDYVFGRNVKGYNSRVLLAPTLPDKFNFDELDFASYVEFCRNQSIISFPSDHFAVVVNIELM